MATVTLQPGPEGLDNSIYQANANANYGANVNILTGQVFGNVYRGMIKFDLSSLPSGVSIVSAILELNCSSAEQTAAWNVSAHRALTQWFEGNATGTPPTGDGSTWNHRNANGSAAWSGGAGGGAGSDYASTPTATAAVTTINNWYSWDVTADVAAFAAGSAANHGWWLIGQNSNGSYKAFKSSDDNLGPTLRPKLTVTYTDANVAGGAAGQAAVAGYVVGARYAVGDAAGQAVTGGFLFSLGMLFGSAAGQATVAGYLVGANRMEGGAAGQAVAAGRLIHIEWAEGGAAGQATVAGLGKTVTWAQGAVQGAAAVDGVMWGWARRVKQAVAEYADPLLYLTDGEERLDLLGGEAGLRVCSWRPAVAQHKNGGIFSESPLSDGRRMIMRRFANAIEVMELTGRAKDQDQLIGLASDLLQWLERAVDYWAGRAGVKPVWLVSKAAYESNPRYALVHTYSIPELEDPYRPPFFHGRREAPESHRLTLRLERGHWQDRGPGGGDCVPLSSMRNWTVADWTKIEQENGGGGGGDGGSGITGDIYSLIQAANGNLLAGTNDAAKIWVSSDDGDTWSLLATLGSGADTVHDMTLDSAGRVFAAAAGSAGAAGIWRSTDHGASWTRVKTHPNNLGYTGVAYIPANFTLVACGFAVTSSSNITGSAGLDGSVWSDAWVPQYWQNMKAAAADDYPFLKTAPPGKSPVGPEAFVGSDGFYTVALRVTRSGLGVSATPLASGAMGNGGLDMTAFAVRRGDGFIDTRALWAVRAAGNVADTEIWQWPDPAAGGFPAADRFGRIATVLGHEFTCLYTDRTPDYNAAERTIWAGGNGLILVSLNSGYTWTQATDAPSGAIRAFVRTAAGRLVAAGDAGEVFIFGGQSGAGALGGVTSETGGSRIISAQPTGVIETCAEATRVANKSSYANLTHVLAWDGAGFSNLQFDTDPPYAFLGDPPATGRACYFGCRSDQDNVPAGPFSSLCFDLSREAENVTVLWEYWDGAAWATLAVQDNSTGFRVLGPVSVHWAIPADWTPTAVNGITGYWVRVRVTALTGAATGPIHYPDNEDGALREDRFIYAASLPFVEVKHGEIAGDIPALCQILWRNQADGGAEPALPAHRLVMGLRSIERGGLFDAYLNLSDRQVPFGLTLADLEPEGGFESSLRAPTGRRYSVSYAGGGSLGAWRDLVRLSLSTTIARDYYGDFRLFLRCAVPGGAPDDWRFRVAVRFGSGGQAAFTGAPFAAPPDVDFLLLDLGTLRIPNVSLGVDLIADEMSLTVQGLAASAGVAAKLYDLILIPTDEWAGDFLHINRDAATPSQIGGGGYLDVDSITNPKTGLMAHNRAQGGLIRASYQNIANGDAMLQTGASQRLWFLAAAYEFSHDAWRAEPEIVGSVRVNRVQRYLGLRGRR